jgi:hypothetical protein
MAIVGTIPLAWLARRARGWLFAVAPVVAYFVGLLGVAATRDAVRRAALAPHFQLRATPTHPEWSNFLVFLVVFVAGLGVIAWLVKLGTPGAEQPAAPPAAA